VGGRDLIWRLCLLVSVIDRVARLSFFSPLFIKKKKKKCFNSGVGGRDLILGWEGGERERKSERGKDGKETRW
jgi:hypothetical protein